jgi:hypothetical protein
MILFFVHTKRPKEKIKQKQQTSKKEMMIFGAIKSI